MKKEKRCIVCGKSVRKKRRDQKYKYVECHIDIYVTDYSRRNIIFYLIFKLI